MNEQDKAVNEYLKTINVEFFAVCRGETKRDDWVCDEWLITLSRPGHMLDTRFYTGTGYRKSAIKMPPDIARLRPNILARVEWERRHLKPVAPTAASVLYSLLSDATGSEEPFDYWCANYGYDSDSRKAFSIYETCCEIRQQVDKFFTREERDTLQKLLENY